MGSVIKKKVQKSAKTNPQNKKATGKKRSVGANKSQQKAVKKARQNEFGSVAVYSDKLTIFS